MKITVKTVDGRSYELNVEANHSVKEVKKRIQDEYEIPTHLQQLMFQNKKLKNNERLDILKVSNDSILGLMQVPASGTKIAAGGFGAGSKAKQFRFPYGFVLDRDQTIIIVDWGNHRIIEWKKGATTGNILVGLTEEEKKQRKQEEEKQRKQEEEKQRKQEEGQQARKIVRPLNGPTDVAIHHQTNSLIICDRGNRRVMSWPRSGNAKEGTVLIDNIACWGVAMDQQGNLYVSDTETHTVKRYPFPPGDQPGEVVAGSREHGRGAQLDQLNEPSYIFVDHQQNVYVTDTWNHRVMKWGKGDNKGLVAARGFTRGLFVDAHETVYVADYGTHKIMRWPKGKDAGEVINVRYMEGDEENELFAPWSVYCDGDNHIYVADHHNQRIQRFAL